MSSEQIDDSADNFKPIGEPVARIVERLKSNISLAELIGRNVPLKRMGRYYQGLCPFHEERTPSFYVLPDDRRFRCYGCGASGDAIDYLQRSRRLTFIDAVEQLSSGGASDFRRREVVDHCLAPVPRSAGAPCGPEDTPYQVTELWANADTPRIAEFYLRSRGLLRPGRPLSAALRGHPRVLYSEPCGDEKPLVEPAWRTWQDAQGQWWKSTHKPAMLAAVTAEDGRITALQRIWCERRYDAATARDARATGLAVRKKTIGHLATGAVRLAPAGVTLGLAEGVETALAAALLFRIPVWAVCGACRLRAVTLPEGVERVLIFADRGEAGERAAEAACTRYSHDRICQIVLPTAQYGDWNDQLTGTERIE